MSTNQILDEIDAILQTTVLEDFDPAIEISTMDYADHHNISRVQARSKLEKCVKQGKLVKIYVRSENGQRIVAYRPPRKTASDG